MKTPENLTAVLSETTKSPLRSKTIWLNLLALISLFVPPARDWLEANPVQAVVALGALNTLVRFATRDRVSLFPPDDESGNGISATGTGGVHNVGAGTNPGGDAARYDKRRSPGTSWLVCLLAAVALPACSFFEDYQFSGRAVVVSEDGAKGGLRFTPGQTPQGFIKYALRDPETGRVTGWIEIDGSRRVDITSAK